VLLNRTLAVLEAEYAIKKRTVLRSGMADLREPKPQIKRAPRPPQLKGVSRPAAAGPVLVEVMIRGHEQHQGAERKLPRQTLPAWKIARDAELAEKWGKVQTEARGKVEAARHAQIRGMRKRMPTKSGSSSV
jgi:hypothetical protein